MDVDMETPSIVDSDPVFVNDDDVTVVGGEGSEETLVLKIEEKGKDEGGVQRETLETKLRGDFDLVGVGEGVVEDNVGDGCEGGVEGVKSGAGEKGVENSDTVDDDLLEDVDVDIDDSGDVRTSVLTPCYHAAVDVGGNEIGNVRGNVEDPKSADKQEKGNEMEVEGLGASHCEETSDCVGKLEQGGTVGELVSGKSGGTVENLVGESEDEEVDIGGDHEPNLFIKPTISTDENVRSGPTEKVLHNSYLLAAGKEGGFSVSDMVWGKVRSHPWWPGQIFDPSKASEIAMKHHKKEKACYLVAFFGDRTFAWSEASQLRHFQAHFPDVEKQSGSEALQHAISCAMEEVSRRFELGLACQCIQSDVYESLRYQNVENAGIQEEACRIESTDESASVYLFEPRNFLHYLKSVAQDTSSGADQLEIVIAKAQLLSFNRLKGFYHLPEYQFNELSLNSYSETVIDSSFTDEGHIQSDTSLMRKHSTMDIVYTSKRERNMDESMLLMREDYEDDENFHISSASLLSGKRQNTGGAPKQSFKIGDCIVRAASQLTGCPGPSSFLKSINEKYQKVSESNEASRDVHTQHENHIMNSSNSIADDVLLQSQSVTHDPMKEPGANNLGNTSTSPDNTADGRNVKAPKSVKGSSEAFEFEDMKDSYWTDRVIQNGGEEKTERKVNYHVATLQPPALFSRTPRVHSRKRYSNGSHKIAAERPISAIDKSKQDMLPAELILNFPDMNSIPSEGKLNNMFRRFGPLKEFETEVDRESNRARVVFKRALDAEVAYSSCEKFNIFGSSVVRYELSYTPSISYKATRLQATQGMETDSLPEIDFASSAHDLEFITMQELEDATMQDLHYPHHHDLEGVTMRDLEFTTNDLEFPVSQDLDIVPTHPSQVTSFHLDVSAQDQQPSSLEMASSGHLEFEAGENMTDGYSAASQGMEIASAEGQQPTNQDPSIKTDDDLESGQVHQIEVGTVQLVEQGRNPEKAVEPTLMDSRGPVTMEISAQDTDNSIAQGPEFTVTEDVDVPTSGDKTLAREQDPVSGDRVIQDKDSDENGTKADATTLLEPEGARDDPMIAEQEVIEDQETNLENTSVAIEESQVASVEDDPVEIEMQDPDVEKTEQDPVEIDATGDSLPANIEDAATETVVTSTGARETEHTEVLPSEIKDTETIEVPALVISNADDDISSVAEDTEVTPSEIKDTETTEVSAMVISNTGDDINDVAEHTEVISSEIKDTETTVSSTGDDVSVVAADTEVETTEQNELQVAPGHVNESPDAEVTHDDNVEIVETQSLNPQSKDDTFTCNVVAEGVTNAQNIENGLTSIKEDEKDLNNQDSKKDEPKLVDSTTNNDEQKATLC